MALRHSPVQCPRVGIVQRQIETRAEKERAKHQGRYMWTLNFPYGFGKSQGPLSNIESHGQRAIVLPHFQRGSLLLSSIAASRTQITLKILKIHFSRSRSHVLRKISDASSYCLSTPHLQHQAPAKGQASALRTLIFSLG